MTQRLIPSQERHDHMVKRIAEGLRQEGFREVQAAGLERFAPPDPIEGYVPDVWATNHHHYIYEVETEDTLELDETRLQWKAFGHYARYNDARFVVVVPQGLGTQTIALKNYYQFRAEVREVDFDH